MGRHSGDRCASNSVTQSLSLKGFVPSKRRNRDGTGANVSGVDAEESIPVVGIMREENIRYGLNDPKSLQAMESGEVLVRLRRLPRNCGNM